MSEEGIVRSLLDYMRSVTACPGLVYADAPARMSGGYDAMILSFALRGAPDPLSGPLVLRLFQGPADARQAPREPAVQNALAEPSDPASRVLLTEARIEPSGGPFVLMERMPGRPLGSEFEGLSIKGLGQTLDIVRQLPRIRREVLRLWDEAQTRLHSLPVSEFVDRVERAGFLGENFTFDSQLIGLRKSAEELGLINFVWPRLAQFKSAKPVASRRNLPRRFPALKHPCRSGPVDRCTRLGETGHRRARLRLWRGARHFCHRADRVPAGLHGALRGLMNNVARAHSRRCQSFRESGGSTLRYYQVFNCVVQLVTVGRNRAQGRTAHGVYNSPVGVANLVAHVHRLSGLKVSLAV